MKLLTMEVTSKCMYHIANWEKSIQVELLPNGEGDGN